MTDIPEDAWSEAKAIARKAVWADGRGMIGRERNYLEDRVARAILADRAAQAERMARLEAALREARDEANEALILAGRLNGGEELQTLMRLNNDLLARATNIEALLRNWLAAEDAWDCNAGDDERVELAKRAARRFLEETK